MSRSARIIELPDVVEDFDLLGPSVPSLFDPFKMSAEAADLTPQFTEANDCILPVQPSRKNRSVPPSLAMNTLGTPYTGTDPAVSDEPKVFISSSGVVGSSAGMHSPSQSHQTSCSWRIRLGQAHPSAESEIPVASSQSFGSGIPSPSGLSPDSQTSSTPQTARPGMRGPPRHRRSQPLSGHASYMPHNVRTEPSVPRTDGRKRSADHFDTSDLEHLFTLLDGIGSSSRIPCVAASARTSSDPGYEPQPSSSDLHNARRSAYSDVYTDEPSEFRVRRAMSSDHANSPPAQFRPVMRKRKLTSASVSIPSVSAEGRDAPGSAMSTAFTFYASVSGSSSPDGSSGSHFSSPTIAAEQPRHAHHRSASASYSSAHRRRHGTKAKSRRNTHSEGSHDYRHALAPRRTRIEFSNSPWVTDVTDDPQWMRTSSDHVGGHIEDVDDPFPFPFFSGGLFVDEFEEMENEDMDMDSDVTTGPGRIRALDLSLDGISEMALSVDSDGEGDADMYLSTPLTPSTEWGYHRQDLAVREAREVELGLEGREMGTELSSLLARKDARIRALEDSEMVQRSRIAALETQLSGLAEQVSMLQLRSNSPEQREMQATQRRVADLEERLAARTRSMDRHLRAVEAQNASALFGLQCAAAQAERHEVRRDERAELANEAMEAKLASVARRGEERLRVIEEDMSELVRSVGGERLNRLERAKRARTGTGEEAAGSTNGSLFSKVRTMASAYW